MTNLARLLDSLTPEQRLEHAEMAAALANEQLAAAQKKHRDEVSDLYARMRRMAKGIEEQDERIDNTVVCVSIGSTTKHLTIRELLDDIEEKYTRTLCTCRQNDCTDMERCR